MVESIHIRLTAHSSGAVIVPYCEPLAEDRTRLCTANRPVALQNVTLAARSNTTRRSSGHLDVEMRCR